MTYDADGNLASVIAPGNARHFTFDSQNRLTCVGGAPGSCATLATSYDASGTRIRDFRVENGVSIERLYADQLFTFYRRSGTSGSWEWGDFHIFAFGEEIARRRDTLLELRAAGLPGFPNFRFEPPPSWSLALAAGLGLALLGALGAGGRLTEAAQRHPAAAGLAGGLVLLLVVPPLPARAGGGGGETERRWLLNDPIGSATVVLASDGVAEREVKYTPFGKVRAESGSNPVETGVFAGHRQESETGLFYMQARWQDPNTGTLISVDPVVSGVLDPQTVNGYAYSRNNPISFTDSSGAFICDCDLPRPPPPPPPAPPPSGSPPAMSISDPYFGTGSLSSLPIGAAFGPSLPQLALQAPSDFRLDENGGIEISIVQEVDLDRETEASHPGFFETFWRRIPILSDLARLADGLKDTFVGASLVIGGFLGIGFGNIVLIFTAPALFLASQFDGRASIGSAFSALNRGSYSALGHGSQMMASGLQRVASGLSFDSSLSRLGLSGIPPPSHH